MRFTLTYDGPLPSRGNAAAKESIRQHLRPQLRELWTHHPLSGHVDYLQPEPESGFSVLINADANHVFAPLVSVKLGLTAELRIVMLRPELPGGVVTSGGDIDNRLKTLFDALRCPHDVQVKRPSFSAALIRVAALG